MEKLRQEAKAAEESKVNAETLVEPIRFSISTSSSSSIDLDILKEAQEFVEKYKKQALILKMTDRATKQ